jgi:hypothetical protein
MGGIVNDSVHDASGNGREPEIIDNEVIIESGD